jgi:hypothetical protein
MDMKEIIENVRADLRARPDSQFSDLYFRIVEQHGASPAEVHTALYEMLKWDEVKIKDGKWRLVAPVERRRAS